MICRLLIVTIAVLAGAPAFADSAFLQHDSSAGLRPETETVRRYEPGEAVRLESKYGKLIRDLASQLGQVSSAEGFRRLFERASHEVKEGEDERKQVFSRGVELSSLTFEEKDVARQQFARFLTTRGTTAGSALPDSLTSEASLGSEASVLLGDGSATTSATRAIRGFHTLPRR